MTRSTGHAAAGALLAALTLLVFHPVLLADYGSSDDYAFYADLHLRAQGFDSVLQAGRPILAGLYVAVATHLERFSQTTVLRAIYLGFLVGCAIATYALASRSGRGPLPAIAIAALATLNLPTVDLGALTPSFVVPLALLLTAGAFHTLHHPSCESHSLARATASFVLLVMALSIYQTAAFSWVFFAALLFLVPAASRPPSLGRLIPSLAFFATAVVGYYLLVMVGLLRLMGLPPTDRGQLSATFVWKAAWFVAAPLRDALNLSALFHGDLFLSEYHAGTVGDPARFVRLAAGEPAYWLAGLVALLIIAGLTLRLRAHPHRGWLLAAALALLPISYALNIAISSIWSPYRTQLALTQLIALYLVVAIETTLAARPRVRGACLVGYVAISLASIYWVNRAYVVEPLACEWESLLAETRRTAAVSRLVAVPASLADAAGPGVRYEIGRPASAVDWSPAAMVTIARRELGLPQPEELRIAPRGVDLTPTSPDWAVIRLGCLTRPPLARD